MAGPSGAEQGAIDALTFRLDRAAMERLLTGADGPVAKDLLRRCIQTENTAKKLCPVDTGRLRASITHAVQEDSTGLFGDIGSNVNYAIYVELTQPFLRQALVDRGAGIGSILDSGLSGE